MVGVRSIGRGTWSGCARASIDDEEPAGGAALWPALGCCEPARDRDGAGEPCRPALPLGRGSGSALDLVGCERAAARGGVFRAAGEDDEAGAPRPAAQAGRDHLSHRCHGRAAERVQRRLGTVLGWGVRRQGACRLRRRCRSPNLRRGERRQRQRHHRGPADADRAGRYLRLRPRLLRLCLVGQARRCPMPDRHPVQIQHAARAARRAAGAGG